MRNALHAASDAVKESLHLKYIAEELDLPVPPQMPLGVDAGAALGFIRNTTSVGRQKHINLRMAWVKKLRQPYQIDFTKVLGTENPARTVISQLKYVTRNEFSTHDGEFFIAYLGPTLGSNQIPTIMYLGKVTTRVTIHIEKIWSPRKVARVMSLPLAIGQCVMEFSKSSAP